MVRWAAVSTSKRVFNDGVAFRYVIPQTVNLESFRVVNEITEFKFAKDAESYPLLLRGFQTAYEDRYSRLALSTIHEDSLIGLPFLVEQPGTGWVAVTEADLDEYAGLYLQRESGRYSMLVCLLASMALGSPCKRRLP